VKVLNSVHGWLKIEAPTALAQRGQAARQDVSAGASSLDHQEGCDQEKTARENVQDYRDGCAYVCSADSHGGSRSSAAVRAREADAHRRDWRSSADVPPKLRVRLTQDRLATDRRILSVRPPVGRDRTRDSSQTSSEVGTVEDIMTEVLFVCVHNAGRSQMAAGLMASLGGERVVVRSAGSAPASEVNPAVVEAMREIGIDISREFPKPLADEAVEAADVVITMGCGDACPIYPGKRYLDWEVEDPAGQPIEVVRRIREEIRRRVVGLLRELGMSGNDATPT